MRKFIIGDLHGCYDLFTEMLEEINFDFNKDIMYSVGDLIDRGPDSMKCLKLIKEPWFHAVRGNHEDLMIQVILEFSTAYLWLMNGGAWHLKEDIDELRELAALANKLPYSITIDDAIGICHAEPPTEDWNDTKNPTVYMKEKMIWGRNIIYGCPSEISNIKETYHGHTMVREPLKSGTCNFIDTGAYSSGILTCVEI